MLEFSGFKESVSWFLLRVRFLSLRESLLKARATVCIFFGVRSDFLGGNLSETSDDIYVAGLERLNRVLPLVSISLLVSIVPPSSLPSRANPGI